MLFMLRLTGNAGFPPSSNIFFSIFSAISKRGISFFIKDFAYVFTSVAIFPALRIFWVSMFLFRILIIKRLLLKLPQCFLLLAVDDFFYIYSENLENIFNCRKKLFF